jgi:hypothetical protein
MRPKSFATVGHRITAWTTNLLATGVVLLLALGVGRQLVGWYRVESPAPKLSPGAGMSLAGLANGDPIELDFGDAPYAIQRREVTGELEEARAALVIACREVAGRTPLASPSAAESNLLELCERETPLETTPDGRRIFAPQTALPLVVVLRPIAPGNGAPVLAGSENRVVTWGMAGPAGPRQWHLFVAHSEERAAGQTGAGESAIAPHDFPLPPGARRMLGLRDQRGGSMSSFAGNGQPAEWIAFLSDWFGRSQWTRCDDWRLADGFWRARYELTGDAKRATLDLEIGPDGAAGLVGFATLQREAILAVAPTNENN